MQFKYPEILYALFLLLIPVFIHLFQLRRFQRVPFTNVAFLKKVILQTRKSSQLKKWFVLLMRLLALACIVFAFAQPYTASKTTAQAKRETVFYVDNSFSMQAKGNKGPLLERALQDLFDRSEDLKSISWLTNNSERKGSAAEDFKNEILKVTYSSNQLSPTQVLLKANQLFSKDRDVQKRLVYISDFQQVEAFPDIPEDLSVDAVLLKAVKPSNISIDTAFVTSKSASAIQLKAKISNQGSTVSEVPISLFNNGKLIAKTSANLSQSLETTISFDIEASQDFKGKLELTEPIIPFDNSLYFSINKPEKIKVLAVNAADSKFLERLFGKDEFELTQQDFHSLDYNQIPDQNFIVLNGLGNIPTSLATALKSFANSGGSVLIIPPSEIDLDSYNHFLQTLRLGSFIREITQDKKITGIMFSHPLFRDVFEKEVVNFQYPSVHSFYENSTSAAPALTYEDNSPFLLQRDNIYLFTAAIDKENSNFLNSPLVVPTLYNMALHSLPLPKLYYVIGKQNTFAVPVRLGPDEILGIQDSITQFIPLQQTKSNHVLVTTVDQPTLAGNYQVTKENKPIQNLSFNYSRTESRLQYLNPEDWEGANVYSSVDSLMKSLAKANSIASFWKWFAIFGLFFLLCEMLILKFLK